MKLKTTLLALLLSASALSAAAPNSWISGLEREINLYFQEDMGLPHETMNVRMYNLGEDTLVFEYRGKMIYAELNTRTPKEMYTNTVKGMTSADWYEYSRYGYKYLKCVSKGGSYTGGVQ